MAVPTARDSDKFVLRLPDGMRDRIKAEADKRNRSMNAEIVAALEAAFPQSTPLQTATLKLAEMSLVLPAMDDDPSATLAIKSEMRKIIGEIERLIEAQRG